MSRTSYPAPPLPRAGQLRAWWRAPASPTALAWYLAEAARAHDAPLLVSARDNHGANQLEADLQTLLGGDPALPVVAFLTGKPCPTTASARIRTSSRSAWLPCTACPR